MSKLTVIIFGVQPHSPHFETQLDVMQQHLDEGDHVIYVDCDRAVMMCDASTSNDPLFCRGCVAKRKGGLRLLTPVVQTVLLSSLIPADEEIAPHPPLAFDTSETLGSFRFDDWDCGEAVLSSLYSITKTRYPSFDTYQDFIQRGLHATIRLYRAARAAIRRFHPDRVYFFNGRGVGGRCFVRACQAEKVRFFSHERGSRNDSFLLLENAIIQDPDAWQQDIVRCWNNNPDDAQKCQIADVFFQNRRQGKNLRYIRINFLKDQVKGIVPEGWWQADPRLVLFTSSETEHAALSGFFDKGIYNDLADALNRIVGDLTARGFLGQLVVRMHPNSASEAHSILAQFAHHHAPFLRMVLPWDQVDTYSLLDNASKVIVANSTLGMEAAYIGKPVILLNRAIYDKLGAVYTPHNHEELMEMLQLDLPPLDRTGTYHFGYHGMSFGQPLHHTHMKGTNKCSFKGQKIRSPWHLDQILKLKRHRPWLEHLLEKTLYPFLSGYRQVNLKKEQGK
ncbi:hypothetical protein WCLP8_490002 [uncultured Gammaproteobacteria bacterium]